MNPVQSTSFSCPCCGSPQELVVDCSVMHQHLTESCGVCCQPFVVETSVLAEGSAIIRVGREDGRPHLFSHISA